jgi:enterochelin esterase-like enzyme
MVLDPATNVYIGYGHSCNGFEVSEPGVDFYDVKDVPHGNLLIKNYFAKTTNSWRRIYVYTPPGYEANASTRYPVLYLQHGGGEDARAWTEMGHANLILDNLLAEGRTKPMIIVMESAPLPGPPSGPAAARGAAPAALPPPPMTPPGGGAYGQLMINDLIPWIDSNFRTLADKDHRAMAGLSMGSMMTASVTMANLDKFSYIGLLSGGTSSGGPRTGGTGAFAPGAPPPPLDLKTAYNGAMADPAQFNKTVHVLFFSSGTEGMEGAARLDRYQEQLIAAGITNSYHYTSPGTAHEWQTWRRSLYVFAPLLFR